MKCSTCQRLIAGIGFGDDQLGGMICTAYITDLGMTGPVDSVLGVKKEQVIQRFLTVRPVRFEVAAGAAALNGAVVELSTNGRAVSIHRIQVHMPE